MKWNALALLDGADYHPDTSKDYFYKRRRYESPSRYLINVKNLGRP